MCSHRFGFFDWCGRHFIVTASVHFRIQILGNVRRNSGERIFVDFFGYGLLGIIYYAIRIMALETFVRFVSNAVYFNIDCSALVSTFSS